MTSKKGGKGYIKEEKPELTEETFQRMERGYRAHAYQLRQKALMHVYSTSQKYERSAEICMYQRQLLACVADLKKLGVTVTVKGLTLEVENG